MPDALLWTYAALVGAAIGSFLNVCVYRWPNGLSVIRPRSRCPSCEAPIAWHDNFPVLGYLLIGGRCRNCRERISVQYPLVELAVAAIWTAAAVRFGPTLEALGSAVFLTILLGIALTDAKHMVIPDQFSLGGALLGILFALAPGGIPIQRALLGAVGGYVLLHIVAWGGEKLFRKPALGLGDVHMMAMIGAFVGLSGMLLTLMLGSLFGVLVGVPLTYARGRLERLNTYLPLGTFLALGAAVTHTWGEEIIGWYLAFALGAG